MEASFIFMHRDEHVIPSGEPLVRVLAFVQSELHAVCFGLHLLIQL